MKEAVEQFRLAQDGYQKSIELRPTRPDMDPAWFFVSCPDPQFRDLAEAIRLAEMGRKQQPLDPYYPQMLGLAYYRQERWQQAIKALDASAQFISAGNRATVLKLGTSMPFLGTLRYARFVLAMAHWRLGRQEQETQKAEQHQQTARQYYQPAVQEMQTPARGDAELRRFRAKAAELLGIPAAGRGTDTGTENQPRQGRQSIARGVSPWKTSEPNRIGPERATDILCRQSERQFCREIGHEDRRRPVGAGIGFT